MGGGAHNQHMGLGAFFIQQHSLAHAEPVLLICNHQGQIPVLHRVLNQSVGSDDKTALPPLRMEA